MDMNSVLSERMTKYQITQENQDALASLKENLDEILDEILGEFYSFFGEYPEVKQLFSTTERMDYAKNHQIKHWGKICSGHINEEYIKSVETIANVHHKINLDPSWYISGYSFIITRLVDKINTQPKSSWKKTNNSNIKFLIESVLKVAMMDMDFSISVYHEKGKEEKENILDNLVKDFDENVASIVGEVDNAAVNLSGRADELSGISGDAKDQTEFVANSIKDNLDKFQTVASASDELNASINEIGSQVLFSQEKAYAASEKANDANEQVISLSNAAEQIGEVTSLIQDIAEQTNLLALNATIEAARAGEAGKGFAVVAQEVKSLASQTGKATKDISEHISKVQTETDSAVFAIKEIASAIDEINGITSSISAAITEQGTATEEILKNIHIVVSESKNISSSTDGLKNGADNSNQISEQVKSACGELNSQTNNLKDSLQKFLQSVKSA